MAIAPPTVVEGTASTAEQAPDGTWTIRNVPLFAAHVGVSARTGKRVVVDKAWLAACVDRQQAEYATNRYLPRLHVNHHDWGDPVEDAGYFLPTRVDVAATRGGLVHAIYGDLVGVRDEVYRRIRANRLPYLSPEVDLDSGHLETCALLPTRPPKGKFTPITIGRERKCLRGAEVVSAYAQPTGVGARVLIRIRPPMSNPAAAPAKDPTEKNGEGAPPAAPVAPAPAAPAAEAVPAWAAAIVQGIQAMQAMLAKLVDDPGDDTPGEPTPASGTPSTAYAEKLAALEGKVAGLETLREAEAAQRVADAEIADAEKQLARYGKRVPNLAKRIREIHKAGGKPALTAFADTLKDLPSDGPATTLDDVSADGETPVALPKDLATKYAAASPDELAKVGGLSRQFDAGGGERVIGMSRTEYVELYLDLASRKSA